MIKKTSFNKLQYLDKQVLCVLYKYKCVVLPITEGIFHPLLETMMFVLLVNLNCGQVQHYLKAVMKLL